MNFRTRFLLLASFNCLLMMGFLYVFSQNNIDFSQRLVDLDLEKVSDRYVFLTFLGGLLGGFLTNFFILSSRKNEFSYDEIRELVNAIRH